MGYQYRSEILYYNIHQLIKDEEVFPICVPSYNRPDGAFLKFIKDGTLRNGKVFLFIRREQQDMYKQYEDCCHIILLENVHNIGETRAKIVEIMYKYLKFDNIFMLDDDITCCDFLIPSKSSTSDNKFMRLYRTVMGIPYGVSFEFFKMWTWMILHSDEKLTLSGPGAKSDYWNIRYKDTPTTWCSASVIQCIHLNLKNLSNHNINYRNNNEVGAEDYAIQYDIMAAGLYTTIFKDLVFCVPSVNGVAGGNSDGTDLIEKYNKYIELFFSNVISKSHSDDVSTKVSKGGVPSVKFKWTRWRVNGNEFQYTSEQIRNEVRNNE